MSVVPLIVVGTVHNATNGVKVWLALIVTNTRLGAGRPAAAQELPQVIAVASSHWQVSGKLAGNVSAPGGYFIELLIAVWMPVLQAALTGGLSRI